MKKDRRFLLFCLLFFLLTVSFGWRWFGCFRSFYFSIDTTHVFHSRTASSFSYFTIPPSPATLPPKNGMLEWNTVGTTCAMTLECLTKLFAAIFASTVCRLTKAQRVRKSRSSVQTKEIVVDRLTLMTHPQSKSRGRQAITLLIEPTERVM